MDLSPDGIFVVNGDRIVFVNPAGLRLLGAVHVDQIVGRPVLDFIHPEDRVAIEDRLQSMFEEPAHLLNGANSGRCVWTVAW